MADLHVFTDDADKVVAASLEDAMAVLREYGLTDPDPEGYEQMDDADTVEIWCDANGVPTEPDSDGSALLSKTCAEWAAARGRGFLCTSEY